MLIDFIIDCMVYFTIYRKKSLVRKVKKNKKKDELKKKILKFLGGESIPVSTQDISLKLDKPWHSVQTRCLRLQLEGAIEGYRIGRINLWQLKN